MQWHLSALRLAAPLRLLELLLLFLYSSAAGCATCCGKLPFPATSPILQLPSPASLQLSFLPHSVVMPLEWRYRWIPALFPYHLPTSLADYLCQLCSRLELLADLPHIVFVAAVLRTLGKTFHLVPSWSCAEFDLRSPRSKAAVATVFALPRQSHCWQIIVITVGYIIIERWDERDLINRIRAQFVADF